MIGNNLKHLKSICVGKETYFKASYWHHELNMLDTLGNANLYAIALWLCGEKVQSIAPLMRKPPNRFKNTNPYDDVK